MTGCRLHPRATTRRPASSVRSSACACIAAAALAVVVPVGFAMQATPQPQKATTRPASQNPLIAIPGLPGDGGFLSDSADKAMPLSQPCGGRAAAGEESLVHLQVQDPAEKAR